MVSRVVRRRLRSGGSRLTVFALVFLFGFACGDDEVTNPGPYVLVFQLDYTFQAAHGGDQIAIALVQGPDGTVIAQGSGTISATQTPSFAFRPDARLQAGIAYEVHYWIDSNIGGGTAGECDAKDVDHQWRVELPAVSDDTTWTEAYDPTRTEDVCATFG